MRRFVVPSEHHEQIPEELERETIPKRSEMERTITLVLESESTEAVTKIAPLPISTPNLALALPIHDIPTNPSANQSHHYDHKLFGAHP